MKKINGKLLLFCNILTQHQWDTTNHVNSKDNSSKPVEANKWEIVSNARKKPQIENIEFTTKLGALANIPKRAVYVTVEYTTVL